MHQDRHSRPRGRRARRGIYLLPTLFTVGNLFAGYASVVRSFQGAVEQAALLIIVAGVLDALDGRIARLTGSTSEFGMEFDSLADMVSFGVAPAMLAYRWALEPLGRIGWVVAFIYVVCAAMRLARFNIKGRIEDKRYFAGLPSPMAAGSLATVAFAFPQPRTESPAQVLLTLLTALVGLLMISRFRYRSFKELDLGNRRSYVYVLPLATVLVAIAIVPRWAMLTVASLYLLSAPLTYVISLVRRRVFGAADEPVGHGETSSRGAQG